MTKEPAKPAAKPDEFDSFAKLAKKLVKVPKRELDAERAKTNGQKP
jgi:hypothetical protein